MPNQTFTALFLIISSLFVFGCGYNWIVAKLETEGDAEGGTWVLVVIGCAVTLIGLSIMDVFVDWNAGLQGGVCFSASGIPMSAGSYLRFQRLKRREKQAVRELPNVETS